MSAGRRAERRDAAHVPVGPIDGADESEVADARADAPRPVIVRWEARARSRPLFNDAAPTLKGVPKPKVGPPALKNEQNVELGVTPQSWRVDVRGAPRL